MSKRTFKCTELHCVKCFHNNNALLKNNFNYFIEESRLNIDRTVIKLPNDKTLSCSPNAARLLCLLLSNVDEIITKDDIYEFIWPKRVVGNGSLPVLINQLRKMLASQSYRIITIRGIGYTLTDTNKNNINTFVNNNLYTNQNSNTIIKTFPI